MACGRNQSSSISPSLSICKLFEATTTSLTLYASPPKQSRSDFFSAFGGGNGSLGSDLVLPLMNSSSSYSNWVLSRPYPSVCCIKGVVICVICIHLSIHGEVLQQFQEFVETQDLFESTGCLVLGDLYLSVVMLCVLRQLRNQSVSPCPALIYEHNEAASTVLCLVSSTPTVFSAKFFSVDGFGS